MVRLYLKTNTIIGSAKTMPTKYIERKLAERVVVLLRSVGEVLAAAKLTMRLGKVALVLRVTPVAELVVRVGKKVAVMAHLVVVMVRKLVAVAVAAVVVVVVVAVARGHHT